ncbi:hypothetical protein Cgig2_027988 [Carnegiea gigantea]|uniref:ADP,ATP carrier protein n=1 Tax=Carnegiea gigantea TaxID=171969 RepID=A0A9Q1GYH0_9CARY|nr:hypothetical protein Cgig2_027988 [Carnegiea gigantea]
MISRQQAEAILSTVVTVKPHETSALLHSASCFFFILSAYFMVLPLRDEGAISLGLSNLPGLFVGSLVLTLIAAPLSTLLFSLPNLPKARFKTDKLNSENENHSMLFGLVFANLSNFRKTYSFGNINGLNRHVKHSHSSTSLPLFSHICLPSVVPKLNSANTFCTNQTLTHSELFLRFQALVLMHRFFSFSLVIFFILWHSSARESTTTNLKASVTASSMSEHDQNSDDSQSGYMHSGGWEGHSWYYISVRIGLFLWIALLNLITISSTWARVIDVMDSEFSTHIFGALVTLFYVQSGSRLFGFIGAGATLGQLFGSLFATGMSWLGPCMYSSPDPPILHVNHAYLMIYDCLLLSVLLLVAAFFMELAAQSSKGITQDAVHLSEEDTPLNTSSDGQTDGDGTTASACKGSSPKLASSPAEPHVWVMLDGLWLILTSTYLIYVSLFLWLGAVVSSFFYFQKVSIIASTTSSAAGRRKLFAEINSFIALFIFSGQITLTGRILTVAGVTIAISSAPFVALLNLVAIAVWPTWVVVAVCETLRKVVTYVVTRPGRELLFTVVSQEEKYKAKVCIDVIVQRLGDATAAGMFKLLFGTFKGRTSTVSLYALPVSVYSLPSAGCNSIFFHVL